MTIKERARVKASKIFRIPYPHLFSAASLGPQRLDLFLDLSQQEIQLVGGAPVLPNLSWTLLMVF